MSDREYRAWLKERRAWGVKKAKRHLASQTLTHILNLSPARIAELSLLFGYKKTVPALILIPKIIKEWARMEKFYETGDTGQAAPSVKTG